MKIRPVRAELFHAGGRTDVTKQIVAFRNFANAPNYGFLKEKVSIVVKWAIQCVVSLFWGFNFRGPVSIGLRQNRY
jgi:hypothetical protein